MDLSQLSPNFFQPFLKASENASARARTMSKDSTQAWSVITLFLTPLDEDSQFWWETAGRSLAAMMQQAGYDAHLQYQGLLFYFHYLAPALGPRPTADGRPVNWKSFMTDDHTPIELSWNWASERAKPIVRLAIEPIGRHAGSKHDFFNTAATLELIRKIQPITLALDLTWFEALASKLTVSNVTRTSDSGAAASFITSTARECQSQLFVAFDLAPVGVNVKAYFLPVQRAIRDRVSRWGLVRSAVLELAATSEPMTRALAALSDYVQSRPEDRPFNVEIVSIDCVAPAQSRIKVYLRSHETSFGSVRRSITFDGTLDVPGIDEGLKRLKELWDLVLGLESEEHEELAQLEHRTAGIVYNFELRPMSERAAPKVYIPVKHYARNDHQIAMGLMTYFERRGGLGGFPDGDYVQILKDTFAHRTLDSGLGMHTYIAAAINDDGSLAITSYLNPEIYTYMRSQKVPH